MARLSYHLLYKFHCQNLSIDILKMYHYIMLQYMIGVMNIDIASINKSEYMWRTIFVLILDRGSFRSSDWLINVKCQIKSPLLLLLQCIMHNVYAWGGGGGEGGSTSFYLIRAAKIGQNWDEVK